jgi:hypothetical protein
MAKPGDIARLHQLADMVLQSDLAKLRAAAQAREATRARLAALATAQPELGPDLGPAQALAMLRYQTWADLRRAELTQTLARETATWLDQQDAARRSFGKAQALDALQPQRAKAAKPRP